MQAGDLFYRRINQRDGADEQSEFGAGLVHVNDEDQEDSQANRANGFDQRIDEFLGLKLLHGMMNKAPRMVRKPLSRLLLQFVGLDQSDTPKELDEQALLLDSGLNVALAGAAHFATEDTYRNDANRHECSHEESELPVGVKQVAEGEDDRDRFFHEVGDTEVQRALENLSVAMNVRDQVAHGGAVVEVE